MLKAVFNEAEAQQVLAMANEKIAAIFLTEPLPVRFVFRGHIAQTPTKVTMGSCPAEPNQVDNEIQILLYPGWQNIAIHELAHLYDPGATEKRTDRVAKDIIRYLKRLDNPDYKGYNEYSEVRQC